MAKLTIVCHPYTPASPEDLETWLRSELDQLREAAPQAIIRLSQLSQDLPDSQIEIGWLIEFESEEDSVLDHEHLAKAITDMCTDMRFLGLQPSLLSPHELSVEELAMSLAERQVLTYPGV
jgi:hypothetical protein